MALYGAVAWGMRSANRKKVDVLEMKLFIYLDGGSRKNGVENEEVPRRAGIERELASRAYRRVLRWFGHVERMDEYRMARNVLKIKSSMARSLPVENLLYRMFGQLSTICSNVLKQPNGELLAAVNNNQLRTMASETVDPIDWSQPTPSWAVPPERLVHSINHCNLSGNRTCHLYIRGNHLAYAAIQGM